MRLEHDFIGELEIADDVFYGVQTFRAKQNFDITGEHLCDYPSFIYGFAKVKKACALANCELKLLDQEKCDYIVKACDEILTGKYNDQFVVDMLQGGAGTSTNMNTNEVIANVGLTMMGHNKGEYKFLHPNDHVNLSQSTNDSYPSAIKIATYDDIGTLFEAIKLLRDSFAKKAEEFKDVIKMGRTQLQDAVPMTLGQEFHAFVTMLDEDLERLEEARKLMLEVNLGGTAIGTGINAHPDFPKVVVKHLREITGDDFKSCADLVAATPDCSGYVHVMGTLKRMAVKLSKTCNDLRLLGSGPRCGLNEINLPKMQPGSSIMPGKVNPVIPEVVNQVCYHVIGADVAVNFAAEAGQLQLNVMEPAIAYEVFKSIKMLDKACRTLAEKCVDGITANEKQCLDFVLGSIGIVTALNPYIGYENSASIAKEALLTGKRVREVALERNLLTEEQLDELLTPSNMLKSNLSAESRAHFAKK
ncbi:MAG: aspartate ammonia-lyase [Anaerobiospirillum succiniciproducens]|uniref:aspartate ammonia-lyase n=1 Tax=Anaerobiospirillum succiniciproducens TaxID=13335 RepID=UPI0026DCB2A3|nr:aspartate ammonia-lyase [Anaerobiospirillum succiniciproducens]MDO4675983.1 aspartate ammonia-lyase [Anaerobiospirillum succiniciproducens]